MELASAEVGPRDVGVEQIADFLFHEADLLDGRQWEAWLDLFTTDGMYWVPISRDQENALNHVSLFYEDALMREVRAKRLEHKRAWSQQPLVQTSRMVGNIRMVEPTAQGDILVRSNFNLVEWREPHQRHFAGRYSHTLRHDGTGLRIVEKRVDLIDCGAMHQTLEIFL